METSIPTLMVSINDSVVVIKVSGRATCHSSVDFKTLVQELRQRGYHRFVLDLRDCLLMDSTFMGVLAGLGQKLAAGGGRDGDRLIELLNPNQRVRELFENLGVTHLFNVVNGAPDATRAFEPVAPSPDSSHEELTRTALEAHKTLMQINPNNVPKFKDVARFLAEDLEKINAQGN